MTRAEGARWLMCAGIALGEAERYWFGSLYDMACDMGDALMKRGPHALRVIAKADRKESGPKLRALRLFARRIAREVSK